MRLFIISLLLVMNLPAFSQEETFQKEIVKLEQKLKSSDKLGLRIATCKEMIKLSFPDHLNYVREYSDELLKLAVSANDLDSKAFAYYYLGEYYYKNDDFQNAEYNYKEALTLYQNLENISQVAQIYHNLGLVNQFLNHYDESLSYYQKSVELAETLGNKEKEAISYQCIGTLHFDLQKYSLSQYYYEKALEIYVENNNEERIAAINQNIGVLYYSRGNFDKSLEYYNKSLSIYENLNDKQNIAISLSNIGLVYEENNYFDEALEYYLKALLIFEEIGYKPTLVNIFYNLGSLYRNVKNYSKSLEYFEKGLELSKKISMKDYISYNYEALSSLFEETGNYSKALSYYQDFVQVKDSILNEEKFRQIGELEAQFQSTKQQKEIEFLKIEQDLNESQLKKKEAQNLILIIGSSLTIIIAMILWLFNRLQKKSSLKLENEIEERIKTEKLLTNIRDELEERVNERTMDIEETNKKLLVEIEEHKKTSQNLEVAKNKAEEADKLKSNFLANMSHEVRTPMNAISGYSQMLAYDDQTDDKRREYISLVQDGCKNLTNLIDDIIDFAEVDSGRIKIEKKKFNPHPMLEFLCDHYTSELVKKSKENIKLIYSNENKEIDLILNTDSSRFKQVLSILIDNGIKFTEEGVVEFGFTHPNESEIQFFVRDSGIGIDEEYEEIIFERFRQIDETYSKKYGGAGIGLSVAKTLVKLLNGKIWFESSYGRGTTFYVNIPFNKDNEYAELNKPEQYNWENKVILIAEDKKINFDIIEESLSPTNVNLVWAKNGKEALKHVESESKIDLVLMDIQMPVMDGYECTRRIKEFTDKIPVVAQTAYALPQDSYKCFEAGCDDYIAKPISLNELLAKINNHLI
ncbi:MAG: tetratricopeptide repeat protein [Bacteroidales bacterium]|nr:tetratricopeptide repeat protein [Bacteroidales bacterium]